MEMLLAMAVFAMLGLATANVMQQVIRSDEISQDAQGRLKALQQTMSMLERDFGQMIPRGHRDAFGEISPKLFEYGDNLIDSDAQGIRFYRLGWLNPQGRLPRGAIQQVIYRLEEGVLQRQYTLYPDPVEGEEPISLDLLDGVTDLKFAFYLEDKWVTQTDAESFPKGVAVELELEDLGVIRRHFLLADGYTQEEPQEQEDNNGGNNPGSGNPGSGGSGGNNDTGSGADVGENQT
ncbi:type II secretion system minor pseudopilin GspJ [Ferrimonas gelatinilytica]|uniref:Type II secretion system minor pseudopilin GspJ n=2 Tax=Ferrimonas gelatinilytica TaxID=1255257 RepID=A0ABP9S988_9GAMM